ncbi:LysR family transcriptional regulator [Roseomonas sp. OT10]|uniref:LysR family transcriptional regulator n=1 Tax=Roseomonas cutis TaxID=2897332 RepID=UPI001E615101|nr:LysR family transcriptional regulator [Roseomonas sp. OT10]UFN49302.1 LysR family transcriptional regulator [Roseomonas sp. OT10]
MDPRLDTRRLRYFVAIAEAGSFSGAARGLAIAQPALSHHMRELETALGERLFERLRQGVVLTEAGQVLLGHARGILDAIARAEGEFAQRRRGAASQRRPVRLAVIPSFSPLVPKVLSVVAERMPGIELYVTEAWTQDSHRMVQAGQLDLAVNLADDRWPLGRPMFREPLVFVTAAGEGGVKPGGEGPIRFPDLCRARLILPSAGKPDRRLMERLARQAGLRLDIAHEVDGLIPRKQAVVAGLGSTIFAPINVLAEVEAGLLTTRPIEEPAVTRLVVMEVRQGFDPVVVEDLLRLLNRLLTGSGGP